MQTIEIKNIGPLKDTGLITITPVTLLIGEQSTGKSTFMKILCFCCWLEKQVMIAGDSVLQKYTHYYRFINELKKFHHLDDSFFRETSYIRYEGCAVLIELKGNKRKKSNARIVRKSGFAENKHNVKLSFLPSERNLLSSVQNIESLYRAKDLDVLFNYILEWGEARTQFDSLHPLDLVFSRGMKYNYDEKTGDVLTLEDGHSKIKPYYASSGVQSALPVQVIASYLAHEVGTSAKISPMEYLKQVEANDTKIDVKVIAAVLREIAGRGGKALPKDLTEIFPTLGEVFEKMQSQSQYKSFHLFVEELEQNLFPKAQFEMVRLLVTLLKQMKEKSPGFESSVFLTTHSPYVLTALNVMILASNAYSKNPQKVRDIGLENCVIGDNSFSAYCVRDGRLDSILEEEYHFIKGDFLDSISDEVDDYTYALNKIVYGNVEG